MSQPAVELLGSLGDECQVVTIEHEGKKLHFWSLSDMCLWRAKTLLEKEPYTIEWLDRLGPDDVLFDVGANIGVYTIYAAVVRGCRVYAFEPEAVNYGILCRNLYLNGLSCDQVVALPLAISDIEGFDVLNMADMRIGGSCHSVHESVSFDLTPRSPKFRQPCVVDYLDRLVNDGIAPHPSAIKIDVDGFEHRVVNGASEILAGQNLDSLIIEINPHIPEHVELCRDLDNLGYHYDALQQAGAARKEGAFQGVGEVVFRREPRPSLITIDAPVYKYPTPHIVQHEIFEADYYTEMLEHFPMPSQMRPLAETGRVRGYEERFTVLLTDQDMGAYLDPERAKFWRAFRDRLFSRAVANQLLDLFDETRGYEGELEPDGLLIDDRVWYNIRPHTDVPARLLSVLFYLAEVDAPPREDLGTSLYVPKDPKFTDPAGHHQPREYFDEIITVAYQPNTALIFPRTNTSFHGVERVNDPNPNRKLVIFNLRKV